MYAVVPKGFFPSQDTGMIMGSIVADQATSFQAMVPKLKSYMEIVRADPAVKNVTGFTGGSQTNTGRMFITLKPLDQRKIMLQTGLAGKSLQPIPIADFTLLLSTTDEYSLLQPLRTRYRGEESPISRNSRRSPPGPLAYR